MLARDKSLTLSVYDRTFEHGLSITRDCIGLAAVARISFEISLYANE
jgi:hypothetical protein